MATDNSKEKYTGFKKKIADKLTTEYDTDERLAGVSNQVFASFGIFSFFYFVGRLIYVGFAHRELALPELLMILLCFLLLWVSEKENNIYSFPTYLGKKLNTGTDKRAKKSRVLLYLGDSAAFALFLCVIGIISDGVPSGKEWIDTAIVFAIELAVMFLFSYLTTEHKVKKYNAYQKQLEEEENNLDD